MNRQFQKKYKRNKGKNSKKNDFDQKNSEINQGKDYFRNLKKFRFLRMIARNLAEYLLPSFLIPEKRFNYQILDVNQPPEIFNYLKEICQKIIIFHF